MLRLRRFCRLSASSGNILVATIILVICVGTAAGACGCTARSQGVISVPSSSSSSSSDGNSSSNSNAGISSSDTSVIRIDDMLIPKDDLVMTMASGDSAGSGGTYSTLPSQYINCRRLWPQGKLYYTFSLLYPNSYKAFIRQALAKLQSETNNLVTFIEADYFFSRAHVNIVDDDGCWSYVGKQNSDSGQDLSLAVPGCMLESIVQHEFIHALGFSHEQSRLDRDSYVDIQWSNIDSDACSNFYKNTYLIPSDFPGYDYGSVMHYTSSAFACITGLSTIIKTNGGTVSVRNNLSSADVSKLKYVYSESNLLYCASSAMMASWTLLFLLASSVRLAVGWSHEFLMQFG